jgi:predicted nucleotidyltransferase
MPRKSQIFAGATYLDKDGRIDQLRRAALNAQRRCPSIRRVILFGSLVTGIATPRSDADLLVVLDASPHRHPRDRTSEILQVLAPLPCSIDLFVFTSEEVERWHREGSPLLRIALTTGKDLL